MVDSTKGDIDVQHVALLALGLIALIAGLLIHAFIIGVNVNDWWKGRSVTSVDHIVTSLGISRIFAQFADTLYVYVVTFCRKSLEVTLTLGAIDLIYDWFVYANIWLTSLLSIVLCVKISNFHSRLFLYLRRMVVRRTGSFIVASGLLSALNSWMNFSMIVIEVTKEGPHNTTRGCMYIYHLYTYSIISFFPFLFYCISTVLLLTFLYHHITKMKTSSNLSVSLETYYSAMKLVSVTFLYNTVYFFGRLACTFYYYFYCVDLKWLYITTEILPVVHSSYLIYRTAKLKNQMSKVLQNVMDFLSTKKDTENRENIEIAT